MKGVIKLYRKFSSLDATETYRRIVYLMSDILAYTVGCDFLTPGYTVYNFRLFFLLISLGLFFVCTFYTTYVCFFQSEWIMILECLAVAGMAANGLGKLLLAVYHRHRMAKQCLDLLVLHQEHMNRPKRDKAMEKSAILSDITIK